MSLSTPLSRRRLIFLAAAAAAAVLSPLSLRKAQASPVVEMVSYGDLTVDDVVGWKVGGGTIHDGGSSRSASWEEASYYANPDSFSYGSAEYLQFARVDAYDGYAVDDISPWLVGQGSLVGGAWAFWMAANTYSLSVPYLIAHAMLESGHGTSELSTGVWYDPDADDVATDDASFSGRPNAEKVFNMYGIGAYDSDPLRGGARRAWEEGWTTPNRAIGGGGRWIAENYAHAGQETLYEMCWNPDGRYSGRTWHMYATDVEWATGIARVIANMVPPTSYETYTVPVYAG